MPIIPMNQGKGKLSGIMLTGGVQCQKYEGKFHTPSLQDRADTKMWFTRVLGNPHTSEGEGSTPALAIQDAIRRTREQIRTMEAGARRLEAALQQTHTKILEQLYEGPFIESTYKPESDGDASTSK